MLLDEKIIRGVMIKKIPNPSRLRRKRKVSRIPTPPPFPFPWRSLFPNGSNAAISRTVWNIEYLVRLWHWHAMREKLSTNVVLILVVIALRHGGSIGIIVQHPPKLQIPVSLHRTISANKLSSRAPVGRNKCLNAFGEEDGVML